MLANMAHWVALILVASVWGGMVFFAAIFAPSVFRFLEGDTAGLFIRRVFPVYYLVLGGVCAAAAVCLVFWWPATLLDVVLLLLVVLGFVVARQYMMPRINHLRDAARAGDTNADQNFMRWHQASVWLNGIQMLIVGAVLLRLGG